MHRARWPALPGGLQCLWGCEDPETGGGAFVGTLVSVWHFHELGHHLSVPENEGKL